MKTASPPFSNVQIELLKLFSTNLPETELLELKKVIADFYAQRSIKLANQAWDEKNLASKDMDDWLNDKDQ